MEPEKAVTANPSRWAVDFAEYLRFEEEASQRHELIDREIVAMAGATRRHIVLLRPAARRASRSARRWPCILERSDLWTRTSDGWTRQLAVDGAMRLKGGAVIDIGRLYEGLPA